MRPYGAERDVDVRPAGAKGIGLFATRDFAAGEYAPGGGWEVLIARKAA